jgi:hypothetical protein
MTQYLYVIDTSIVNGVGVSVGQTTYDLLVQERLSHGVIPIENGLSTWVNTNDNVGIYTTKFVGIGTANPTSKLHVVGDALITGTTNSPVYTASGTLSSTDGSTATIIVDASTTQLYRHSASFNGDRTFQISNLTNGRSVYLYFKNTNSSFSRIISIQASTTTSGYSPVELSRSGSGFGTSFTISATNGTATVWVANIGGNLVGSLS